VTALQYAFIDLGISRLVDLGGFRGCVDYDYVQKEVTSFHRPVGAIAFGAT